MPTISRVHWRCGCCSLASCCWSSPELAREDILRAHKQACCSETRARSLSGRDPAVPACYPPACPQDSSHTPAPPLHALTHTYRPPSLLPDACGAPPPVPRVCRAPSASRLRTRAGSRLTAPPPCTSPSAHKRVRKRRPTHTHTHTTRLLSVPRDAPLPTLARVSCGRQHPLLALSHARTWRERGESEGGEELCWQEERP